MSVLLFNERANDFPLYTEAIKFFNHSEPMIRTAVRTLTLNIYRIDDDALRRFILDRSAVPYFSNLVWYLRDQVCMHVCLRAELFVSSQRHCRLSLCSCSFSRRHAHLLSLLRFRSLMFVLRSASDAPSSTCSPFCLFRS